MNYPEDFINKVICGDCMQSMKELPDNSIDSIVTDPPYGLGFMGKSWDNTGIANNPEMWKECLRVLKPGGYLLSFSGTRTYHRMAVAIEDAGFEVRDMITWNYGQGFPKSLNISLQIKKKYSIGLCTCSVFEPMIELEYENNNNKRDNISNGNNDGFGIGEQIQSKRTDYNEVEKQIKDTNISPNNAFGKAGGMCKLQEEDNKKEQGLKKVAESILQSEFCESISEDKGLGNTKIWTRLEENQTTSKREGRSMQMLQQEGQEQSTGSSPSSIQNGGGEHNGKPCESLSELPQQDRENNRTRIEQIKNDCSVEEWRNLSRFICSKCYCIKKDIGGTALKPSIEPICMARKPLGQQEIDIAKNICYNITEKGLITNSKIIWRINNVKTAEKQKTKQSSTPTQQQKMVVVSAEFVETKENESVGKKIQKLIENICESGMQETGNKQRKQVQKVISKIEIDGQNTTKNTSEEEKKNLLSPMEESVSVVENQDLSSLPLTTLEVAEDSIEKKSKTETSMSSLKSTDTQKTDTDCSALTATSQWVCMDIARTLKVSFEGKEYDFIELSDGSLVWNENLEPYRKQQKLNIAENVLKYGTGGINIDESRVDTITEADKNNFHQNRKVVKEYKADDTLYELGMKTVSTAENPQGRFPANLIHDNSEEVRGCFPDAGKGNGNGFYNYAGREYDNKDTSMFNGDKPQAPSNFNDSGNSSRFFKSIIYQAKASKSERNKGLDGTLTVKYNECISNNKNLCKEENMVAVQLLRKVISEQELVSFSTGESGESIMVQCQSGSLSTILTETKRIIELKIYNSLMLSLTNESTQVANSEMEVGGNLAESVADLKRWLLTTTKGNQELALGASRVVLETLQLISEKENWKNLGNFHSTVKPIALMEYLIKMVTPKGGTVLDPFMGSGSTGCACVKLGFDFIGCEMEKEYCDIGQKRLDAYQAQKKLF